MGKDLDRTAENESMVKKAANQVVELSEDKLDGVSGGTSDEHGLGHKTVDRGKYHTCGTKLSFLQKEGTYFCPICKKMAAPAEILDHPGGRIGTGLGDYIVKG